MIQTKVKVYKIRYITVTKTQKNAPHLRIKKKDATPLLRSTINN